MLADAFVGVDAQRAQTSRAARRRRRPAGHRARGDRAHRRASARSSSCSGTPIAGSACRASTRRTPTARCGRRARFPGGRGSSLFPACQNMMLAAHALGVSSLFTTFFGLCEADVKRAPPRAAAHVPRGRGVPRLRRRAAREAEAQAARRGRPPERLGGAVPTMTTIPRIVSADDHVVEPPDVFTSRLPAKYRDVGPRVVRGAGGGDDVPRRQLRHPHGLGSTGRRRAARRLVALRGPRSGRTPGSARARGSHRKTCRSCR